MTKEVTNFLADSGGGKEPKKGFDFFGMFKKNKVSQSEASGSNFKNDKDVLGSYQDSLEGEKEKKNIMNGGFEKEGVPVVKEKKKEGDLFNFSEGGLKTNLMSEDSMMFFDWKMNIINLLIAVSVSVLVVGGVYAWLSNMEGKVSRAGDELVEEIKALDDETKELQKNMGKVDKFQKKLSLSAKLLEKHIYWTNFFDFLEESTLKNVEYVDGFAGDTKGEYTISTESRTYSEIDDQVDTLNNSKYIKNAKVVEAGLQVVGRQGTESFKSSVAFVLTFEADKEIFYK